MKQSINTIAIIILMIFLGCSKKDTTPNTNNINNTSVTNAKWIKTLSTVQYAADGVTETIRNNQSYDGEGRPSGSAVYSNGVLFIKMRDYTYIGNDCIYYQDQYSAAGTLSSTTKFKVSYKND
jgi:hypothetical protein